jgi:hypothetical protein
MASEEELPSEFITFDKITDQWIGTPDSPSPDVYKFLDSGASGLAYVNNSTNRIVKIIRYNGITSEEQKEFIESCTHEAERQERVGKKGLAPKIYYYDFVPNKEDNPFVQLSYFYIEMDYLSSDEWEHVFAGKDTNKELCKFIKELVTKTNLYNSMDPNAHFYRNYKTKKINMIDYGRAVECTPQKTHQECINLMANKLELNCMVGGKRKRNKQTHMRKQTHKRKYKQTHMRKQTHKRKYKQTHMRKYTHKHNTKKLK